MGWKAACGAFYTATETVARPGCAADDALLQLALKQPLVGCGGLFGCVDGGLLPGGAGAEEVAVAVDVVDSGDWWPEFVVVVAERMVGFLLAVGLLPICQQ